MIKLIAIPVVILLSSLLAGCPPRPRPLNQPQVIFADGAYTHEQSGMTFPLAVGDFRRILVERYDQDGLDLSAGYDLYLRQQKIAATVYVYPAPPLVSIGSPPGTVASTRAFLAKSEFEARKHEVLQPRPGARLIEDTEISVPIGGTVRVGRMATFEYEDQFAGRRQSLRSHLCMFNYVGGTWALKYRITYPASLEATHEIDTLLQGVPWNVPKE